MFKVVTPFACWGNNRSARGNLVSNRALRICLINRKSCIYPHHFGQCFISVNQVISDCESLFLPEFITGFIRMKDYERYLIDTQFSK